jgi:hypothetical protein
MDCQDWTTVVLRKNSQKSSAGVSYDSEKARLAKLDQQDIVDAPKKRVQTESLQSLIRKRIEMKLNQEKADQLCNFPRNTFKNIESYRELPTPKQQSIIQKVFGVQIKIHTIQPVQNM